MSTAADTSIAAPLELHHEIVRPEWIDYNDHMNVAYFVHIFDRATDAFFDFFGADAAYRQRTRCTYFTLECDVSYLREVKVGEPVRITTQLLDFDHKRLHYFHRMYNAEQGHLAATNELLSVHIDRRGPATTPMPADVTRRLQAIMDVHRVLGRPDQAGRVMGIRRRPPPAG